MNKGIGRRSWWIVAASAVATIGTSAPEGGLILDEEERSALPSDEVVQFDVIASRKAFRRRTTSKCWWSFHCPLVQKRAPPCASFQTIQSLPLSRAA